MTARLVAALAALGGAGVIGLGLLAQCAAFYVFAMLPQQRDVEARQRLAGARAAELRPVRTVDEATSQVERFYGLFPPFAGSTDEIERLHRYAATAGLQLVKGEYRVESREGSLVALHASFPLRGTYAGLRRFFAAVLEHMPIAAIDGLRFERKKPGEEILDAQVQMTLFFRPDAGSP